MHVTLAILIGLVAGSIAKAITSDEGSAGYLPTATLGMAGSLIASFGGQALHLYRPGHAAEFLASIVGAVVMIGAWHLLARGES